MNLRVLDKKLLIGLVVIVAVIATLFFIPKKKIQIAPANNFKTHIETNLTPDLKTTYDKKIAEDQAKLAVSKAQNVPPNEVQLIYLDLGLYEYLEGNLLEAKDAFEKAKDLHPGAAVWVGLYPVLRDMGDLDGEEEALQQAVRLNPADWNMWRAYIEFEQYQRHASNDDLDKIYKQALDGTHMDLNIITVYAQFLEKGGDLQSALNFWKIAVQQMPNNKIYQAEVARLQKVLGQK
jgi:tetratricopeptide (TPR) repeat protein